MLSSNNASAATSGDYDYELINGDTGVQITGYHGGGGDIVIPGTIDGVPVTSIGGSAFTHRPTLTSITIPDSVTSIEWYMFYGCTSLIAIDVYASNANYASIDGVLYDNAMTILNICPEGKAGAFTIPNSVTSIGEWAFCECASLTSVTIPNSVTYIGFNAFRSCNSLTSVTIPDSVTFLGETVFWLSTSLTTIDVDVENPNFASIDGVLYDKSITTLIECPTGKVFAGTFTIPDGVKTIGLFAFCRCALTSVTIPNTVTGILEMAFGGCTLLNSVTIPNSVTFIGQGAFASCAITSVTIPSSVTSIWDFSFYACTSLTSVTIPGSVTTIENAAFCECSSLTEMYFEGNAPTCNEWCIGGNADLIIYYYYGHTGFTNPWCGVPTVCITELSATQQIHDKTADIVLDIDQAIANPTPAAIDNIRVELQQLVSMIQNYMDSGAISLQNGQALLASANAALKSVERSDVALDQAKMNLVRNALSTAENQLNALLNKLRGM